MKADSLRATAAGWVEAALILGVVALLYGHTLDVPYYLDDTSGLVENYLLRDLPAAVTALFNQRGLTNLTFALNYRLAGWSLAQLHLTNVLLHAGCGLLAWRLLLRLLPGRVLPLLGALLFVAHPLQTQAVTYLIQRSAVLGAFFFLLAVLCYLAAGDALERGVSPRSGAYLTPYLAAVLAGACAVLAKESTATLPLVLIACDRLFPRSGREDRTRTVLAVLPFCLVPALLAAVLLLPLIGADLSRALHYPLSTLQHNSPGHYFVTQFSVLWVYLRLLLLPVGQALEHNYAVAAEILTLRNTVALTGWLVVGWLCWRLRRRRPLLAFGAAWFFLTLAVESSVIPLDPLFEHRLYLPMFGFVLVFIDSLSAWLSEQWRAVVVAACLLACLPLTWQRNALWRDPIAFYEDNLRVVPYSERAAKNLAVLLDRAGREQDALVLLQRTLGHHATSYLLYPELARRYARAGEAHRALALLEKGMAGFPAYGALYEMAAAVSINAGNIEQGFDYLRRGMAASPAEQGRLLNTLGIHYSDLGDRRAAEGAFRAALALPAGRGDRANILLNLAKEIYWQERWGEAVELLRDVLRLTPGDPVALERLGEAALMHGDRETARWAAGKLIHSDPEAARRLREILRDAGWRES